jgi:hypothetical protein
VSTILKALRRLEEEKTRDGAPRPLREEIASGPGEHSRSRSRRGAPWMLFAALLLGAGVGASAWWFWPYERTSEAQDFAAAEPATRADPIGEPVPSEPRGAAPVAPIDPTEAVAQDVAQDVAAMTDEEMVEALRAESQNSAEEAFSSLVEVVQRPPAEPRIAPVEPKPAPAVASAPAPERRAAVARKRERARAQEAPETQGPAAAQAMAAAETPPPRGARQVPVAAPPVSRSQEPVPITHDDDRDWPVTSEWQEPSHEPEPTRDTSPTSTRIATTELSSASGLHVKRTQWHPEHARRSAEIAIGGKESSVQEGDVVGEYVVQEIKPSGVVLVRDGEHYERRVGAK